ncbi:MAG: hypothetical protein ACF8TS_02950, partial [Maioricimonas sp. JB049]
MLSSPFDPLTEDFSRLDSTQAVELIRDLLWAEAFRIGLPTTRVSITTNVNIADGGVDVAVLVPPDDGPASGLLEASTAFQVKAGSSSRPWQPSWVRTELFGHAGVGGEHLGNAVRDCLQDGYRYVLVCTGIQFTEEQRRAAVKHFGDMLAQCGFGRTRIEVWGQSQLLGLLRPFPSLCYRVSRKPPARCQTFAGWALDAEMQRSFVADSAHCETCSEIRQRLRGPAGAHVRVLGEPGVGKTRLVLETLREETLAPLVVYARDPAAVHSSEWFHEVLGSDSTATLILIVDECNVAESRELWNVLKFRSGRVRLITIDHGVDDACDDAFYVFRVPPLGLNAVREILARYIQSSHEVLRWAEFCEGSPRVAHLVGSNLQNDPYEMLRSPASVDVWGRFIAGSDDLGSREVEQRTTVLRCLSLFERCGIRGAVQFEGEFVSRIANAIDAQIDWGRFRQILAPLQERRIVQGRSTCFLVPKMLQVKLFAEFWELYGDLHEVSEILNEMPASLERWFVPMLKYCHLSSVA